MSCYVIESDKLFLCCKDIKVMEVYKIDSLYIAPVLQKHWTLLATVQFGDDREFEALQIGDRDMIRGRELEKLMQDLKSLGIMVNREGLCFLKTPENISDQYQVDYYRLFDLFDWWKYHVKSRLNTRWTRNDIADGRPLLEHCVQILSKKEAELKETNHQQSKRLDELNRDIKELKCKRLEERAAFERIMGEMEKDIEELKHNHTEELAEKVKAEELSKEDSVIKNLEKELQLYFSKPSNDISELMSIIPRLMNYIKNLSPVWRLDDSTSEPCHKGIEVYLPPVRDIFSIILVFLPLCRGKNSPISYVRTIAFYTGLLDGMPWGLLEFGDINRKGGILFYDGRKETKSRNDDVYYPSPGDPEICPSGFEGWGVFYVPGYGFRFGFVFVTP